LTRHSAIFSLQVQLQVPLAKHFERGGLLRVFQSGEIHAGEIGGFLPFVLRRSAEHEARHHDQEAKEGGSRNRGHLLSIETERRDPLHS